MGFVTYGQAGYVGKSMSVRAAEAYDAGEKPIYKWTKSAILAAIEDYCYQFDLKMPDEIGHMRKKELLDTFIEYKSWHHTGAGLRETEFYGLSEDAVCAACPEMSREEIASRDAEIARERENKLNDLEYKHDRETAFVDRFGCHPSSVKAYEAIHPEMCERFVSKKGTECISYRLPDEAVAHGYLTEQVVPLELAGGSRVACFDAFRSWEGEQHVWHDVDFDAVREAFDGVAKRYGERSESLDDMCTAKSEEADMLARLPHVIEETIAKIPNALDMLAHEDVTER